MSNFFMGFNTIFVENIYLILAVISLATIPLIISKLNKIRSRWTRYSYTFSLISSLSLLLYVSLIHDVFGIGKDALISNQIVFSIFLLTNSMAIFCFAYPKR